MLTWNEIHARCAAFAERWKDATDEDADAKSYWDDLFTCFGTNRRQVAAFEAPVRMLNGNRGFIDLLWKGTLVVEHKSRGRDLAAARQQALDYIERLKPHERPHYLVTCDFHRFVVHDLHEGAAHEFTLPELAENAEILGFLGGYRAQKPIEEAPVNIEAVERLGTLYDAMKAGGYPEHDLPRFLVRILFCLFAEDTGVFGRDTFTDFILYRTREDGSDLGPMLDQFFRILDTPRDRRQANLDELLAGLDYVNGSVFSGYLAFPALDGNMRAALLKCTEFDWAQISPAIFGSLFQGVMNSAERRAIGAHYTNEENILKLIRPLFLDDLRAELAAIVNGPARGRESKLDAFHEKLASLHFLDPACGCGNFLVITYRELRKLELDLLKVRYADGQLVTDVSLLTKVRPDQFHGIEIEEFPADIAYTAMWLMDHIENLELGHHFGRSYVRLPLIGGAHIVHANALQTDWKEVLPPEQCSYILGNPPFVGSTYFTARQKADMKHVWQGANRSGLLDLVTAWYRLAAEYIHSTTIRAAFVSTNSITQGEQTSVMWGTLLHDWGTKIHFAYRTFVWESEARGKAHVHCVIIGFGDFDIAEKPIFDDASGTTSRTLAKNINPYLIDAPDILVSSRSTPLSPVSPMFAGIKPVEDGNYLFTEEEKAAFVAQEPQAEKWFRKWVGSREFINGTHRWYLWLGDCPPHELRAMPLAMERVARVREFRAASKKVATRKLANTPTQFETGWLPNSDYLIIPGVSSERRNYIPLSFMTPETIASNLVNVVPDATLYHFGVLSSAMHMDWMRQVAGRLKSDYRYSAKLVYNNFPWPASPSGSQRDKIAHCAQAVLDARAQFPDSSLADLYDPNVTPPALARAHQQLDAAVDRAYRPAPFANARERIEHLFAMYEALVGERK